MRTAIFVIAALAALSSTADAFSSAQVQVRTKTTLNAGYVPEGFTPEQWENKKKQERHIKKTKHFKSRSLQSFQEDFDKGRVRHLFPTVFAKERLEKHQIRPSDVPYMQRAGGSYDNKDVNVGYVPDGMTPHQWHDMQRKEKKAMQSKEFARRGPKGFKSRSLQSFQEELEKGKVSHLMPVMFAKQRVKKGDIKQEDVPYMQRGGAWDNSDVNTASKRAWTETDKKYARGDGPFAFLSGTSFVSGAAAQQSKQAMTQDKQEKPKKKFFGLFP